MVLKQHASSGGRQGGEPLSLLRNLLVPPPPAPVAWVETLASSPAASPQVPAHEGEGGGVNCTDVGKKKGGESLLLLQSLRLPPPLAPVARVVAPASSPATPPQMPAHGGSMWGTLPLPVILSLPSPLATVAWVEAPASSPAASLQVPAHGGEGRGVMRGISYRS